MIIDGSHGGGQLLRTALALSVISQKPFKMINIRGKRENPGLQPQHLTAVNAVKVICNAEVRGNELDSKELEFKPGKIKGGKYKFDIGTAGSTNLIFQTLLPILLFADKESEVEIKGGTANPLAPPSADIKEVFLWNLKKFGIETDFKVIKEGFYPKGEGKIVFKIKPQAELKEVNLLERGSYVQTNIFAVASEDLEKAMVAKRLIKGFRIDFERVENVKGKEEYVYTASPGCYIHANIEFENCKLGYTLLGKKGKPAEDIGKECAEEVVKIKKTNASVDHFTADQLLIYLALANGSFITDEITDHLKSNAVLIEEFLPVRFRVEDNKIECFNKEFSTFKDKE